MADEVDDATAQRERLETLGEITAAIAHEIRNPLQFIANYAEVVSELSEELRDIVHELGEQLDPVAVVDLATLRDELDDAGRQIVRHSHRLDAIVEGMVATSAAHGDRRRLVDLNEVVADAARLAHEAVGATPASLGAELVVDLAPDLGPIQADPIRLSQAVVNLVANALQAVAQATSDGGPPLVRLATASHGEHRLLVVDDNGPGIPEDLLDRVFEPFLTTRSGRGGAGLGLAQAWDTIVTTHGGTVVATRRPSGGTTMTVTLPA